MGPRGGDWFDDGNWSDGVPNAPGDAAVLDHASTAVVDVAMPVTLGRLEFAPARSFLIRRSGPLRFDNGDEPAVIEVQAGPRAATLGLETPIAPPLGGELRVDVPQNASLIFFGGLAPGGGDLLKRESGTLTLPGPGVGWAGALRVEAGELRIEHTQALADSTGLTAGRGAAVTIVSQDATPDPSFDNYALPSVALDGGTLQTNLGADREVTRVDAAIALRSDSVIQVPPGDRLHIHGGISGAGGLSVQRRADPSAPDGNIDTFLQILGPTTYSGETYIGPDMRVAFEDPAGLGDSSGGTRIDRAIVELSGGGDEEKIEVDHGVLSLGGAVTAYGHQVSVRGGVLSGGDDQAAVLGPRLSYAEGLALGRSLRSVNLVLAGGVEGLGSLVFQNEAEVQSRLAARGNVYAHRRSDARISGALDVAGEVFVEEGALRLTGDIGTSRESIHLVSMSETAGARLFASRDNAVGALVLDPRRANREHTFDRSIVSVQDDAVLTVADELRFLGGTLSGAIIGQSVLTKKDRTMGILDDIAGSGFERVRVAGGPLVVRGDTGPSPPSIRLGQHDTARVVFETPGDYQADVHLNNSPGYAGDGALTLTAGMTFSGDVFLGDAGATISWSPDATIAGAIHGGALTLQGGRALSLEGGDHTYSGATRLLSGDLLLIEDGRLDSTSAIFGGGRYHSPGGRPQLLLDNSGARSHNDRIPDATPVYLEGMLLGLRGRAGEAVTETLGDVHLTRGFSDLVVENPVNGATTLSITALHRAPGGALSFQSEDAGGKVLFAEAPTLDDGLIGGWALFDSREFATYGPNGVVAYGERHSYAASVETATARDNVLLTDSSSVLTGDSRINSLTARDSEIALNGHTLTVESGGLLAGTLRSLHMTGPGQLTAGTEEGAELLITGSVATDADIVDNPQGAVGLTYSLGPAHYGASLTLSGENSYSGPTVVNSNTNLGALELASADALPSGGDVILNGGHLHINHDAGAPLAMGRLELRDASEVASTTGGDPQIRPESIEIESGSVRVDVVGDGPITKTGPLQGRLFDSLSMHTGPIAVEEGELRLQAWGPAPADDEHAITVHRRGRLHLDLRESAPTRKLRLEGGVIETASRHGFSGVIEVSSSGGTLRNLLGRTKPAIAGSVAGEGPLTVEGAFGDGRLDFAADLNGFGGRLRIAGGDITVRGDNSAYAGPVTVTAADVRGEGAAPFGAGRVTILPDSQLSVGNPLAANLELSGGSLKMELGDFLRRPVLDGSLLVSEPSYVFVVPGFNDVVNRPTIRSQVRLAGGSRLTVARSFGGAGFEHVALPEQVRLVSDVYVEGVATITSFDNRVEFTGALISASARAELRLEGNDTFSVRSSVRLAQGASLAIVEDGAPGRVSLGEPNKSLAGEGTLVSNVSLSDGAGVSPGRSAGQLAVVGAATVGGGAIYEWETADTTGQAGVDWDLWRTDGELTFEATPDDPWVLRVNGLPGLDLEPHEPWLIATAESVHGFDPASVRIDVAGLSETHPAVTAEQFSLHVEGGEVRLQFVPEPAAVSMAAAMILLCAGGRRHPAGRTYRSRR